MFKKKDTEEFEVYWTTEQGYKVKEIVDLFFASCNKRGYSMQINPDWFGDTNIVMVDFIFDEFVNGKVVCFLDNAAIRICFRRKVESESLLGDLEILNIFKEFSCNLKNMCGISFF